MSQYSADDLFSKWIGSLRDNQDSRYLHSERPELLRNLFELFKEYEVEFEDAKIFKRSVLTALITPEGMKNKGKHKGWKDAVFSDFDSILADVYIEDPKYKQTETKNEDVLFIPNDMTINEWLESKIQNRSIELVSEVHKVGSGLNIMFLQDNFEYRSSNE